VPSAPSQPPPLSASASLSRALGAKLAAARAAGVDLLQQQQQAAPVPRARAAPSSASSSASSALEGQLEKGMFEDAPQGDGSGQGAASSRVEALCALEAIEARMLGVTSKEVVVWRCRQCARDSSGEPLASCREAGHDLARERRTLHYFKCGSCSHKLAHPGSMCAVLCPKCSRRGPWLAASIHNIREGDAKGLTGLVHTEDIMSLRFG
jgi:hypothetical protein